MAAPGSTTAGHLRRRAGIRVGSSRLGVAAAVLLFVALAVGFVFAGAAGRLAAGTKIGGVDVGGMTPVHARAVLASRAASLDKVPVTFIAGNRSWRLSPYELGVKVDWRAAVAAARRKGDGFALVRGFRRLALRFSPATVTPRVIAYDAAVDYEVGVLAAAIDRPARDARLARHGLRVVVEPGRTGTVLDRTQARQTIVQALSRFDRAPVELPVRLSQPRVTSPGLATAQALDQRILSAPVTLELGARHWQLSRWQLASVLVLQANGGAPSIGGNAANAYFAHLFRVVSHPARAADFAVDGSDVSVVPGRPGLGLDVPRTIQAVLAAAERPGARTADLVISKTQPSRTTAQAQAMGVTGLVSSYETFYGGIPNRIHNVELVAHLIDGKLVAPGATFSFNEATGERTAAKGFLEAPVIINGELQTALGGGVCQVSTTVFNAAYEAGLPITARTNHALYISHYPLGRDATVDYPDIDLKFVNDTKHWLLLRTFVGSSSLVVSLYGTPQHRRVVTETAPLTVVAPPPVQRTVDPDLKPGQVVVDDYGVPAQTTSVHRLVYAPGGKLLYDNTWYSSYRAQPKIVLVGPKAKKPAPKPTPLTPIGPMKALQ